MKKLIAIACLLVSTVSFAFKSGNAPWCGVDQMGNMSCYYYTYDACTSNTYYVTCVLNNR
jgi:hypothetical protein